METRLFSLLVIGLLLFTCNKPITYRFNRWNYKNFKTHIDKNMDGLIYQSLVRSNQTEFIKKVRDVSRKLRIEPNWLMGVMYIESVLSPTAQNAKTQATGLIQFMPDTALELGTTIDELKQMSNVAQLDYVYAYLKPYKGKMNSFVDVYFAVFFPRAIKKNPEYVLQASGLSASKIASQNSGYDIDRNKELTVQEVETSLLARINPSYHEFLKKPQNLNILEMSQKTITFVLAVLLIVSGGLQLYTQLKS